MNGYKKHGINSLEELINSLDKIHNNIYSGNNIIMANIQIGGVLAAILLPFLNAISMLLGLPNMYFLIMRPSSPPFFIVLAILIIVGTKLNNILLYNNKYLAFFKEFEKMSKKESLKWSIISLIFVIFVYVFFSYSIYLFVIMAPF